MKLPQKLNANTIHASKCTCEVTQLFITTPSVSLIHAWAKCSFARPAALPDAGSLPQQGMVL